MTYYHMTTTTTTTDNNNNNKSTVFNSIVFKLGFNDEVVVSIPGAYYCGMERILQSHALHFPRIEVTIFPPLPKFKWIEPVSYSLIFLPKPVRP